MRRWPAAAAVRVGPGAAGLPGSCARRQRRGDRSRRVAADSALATHRVTALRPNAYLERFKSAAERLQWEFGELTPGDGAGDDAFPLGVGRGGGGPACGAHLPPGGGLPPAAAFLGHTGIYMLRDRHCRYR